MADLKKVYGAATEEDALYDWNSSHKNGILNIPKFRFRGGLIGLNCLHISNICNRLEE